MDPRSAGPGAAPIPRGSRSRRDPRRRLALGWSAADSRLAPAQEALLAVALMACIAMAAAVLVQAVRLARGLDPPPGPITWDCGIRETASPTPSYNAASPADPLPARPPPALPRIDWSDAASRRRAASLLCLHEEIREALEVMPPGDRDRPEIARITPSRNEIVLGALDSLLPGEEMRVRDFLRSETSSSPDRSAPRGTPPPAPGGRAAWRTAALRRLGEGLPDGILYRSAINLHCALRDLTGASDAHLRLVLETCFPPGSPARKLYGETEAPAPIPYAPALERPKGAP